jgi:hypothetical protein
MDEQATAEINAARRAGHVLFRTEPPQSTQEGSAAGEERPWKAAVCLAVQVIGSFPSDL